MLAPFNHLSAFEHVKTVSSVDWTKIFHFPFGLLVGNFADSYKTKFLMK